HPPMLPEPTTGGSKTRNLGFGTPQATGAIADSGTLHEPNVNFVGNHLDIKRVFTGAQGTITIRIESTLTHVVGHTGTFTRHWVVMSGTGAYLNLHGQGLRAATIDTNTGVVTETVRGRIRNA